MTTNTVSLCRVEIFHYKNIALDGSKADDNVVRYTLQREVLSFEFSKNMSMPSGQFTIQLTATVNWKKVVFPGDWLLVYLSNAGEDYLRLLGNIDRVSQFTTKNELGLLETSYIIVGRDFGKVFETTNIWFNPYNTVRLPLSVLSLYGSPDKLVRSIVDTFLGGKVPLDMLSKQPQFNQGIIPHDLARIFSASTNPFSTGSVRLYDILKMDLAKLSGIKAIKNLGTLQGNLWQVIKQNSNEVVNEMYCDLIDGVPTLKLRMIPFASKKYLPQTLAGEITYFESLDTYFIQGQDIIGTDIGYSDSEKHNLFLMTASSDILGVEQILDSVKGEFPKLFEASIQRDGLRLMYTDTEFALISGNGENQKMAPDLIKQWNRFLYEIYKDSVFMETGTINVVRANPFIRVGNRLKIINATINNNKVFYVEGYTDTWAYPGSWTQTFQLTRGHSIDQFGQEVLTTDFEKEDTIYSGQTVAYSSSNEALYGGIPINGLPNIPYNIA